MQIVINHLSFSLVYKDSAVFLSPQSKESQLNVVPSEAIDTLETIVKSEVIHELACRIVDVVSNDSQDMHESNI